MLPLLVCPVAGLLTLAPRTDDKLQPISCMSRFQLELKELAGALQVLLL